MSQVDSWANAACDEEIAVTQAELEWNKFELSICLLFSRELIIFLSSNQLLICRHFIFLLVNILSPYWWERKVFILTVNFKVLEYFS